MNQEMSTLRTCNIEAGLPVLDEARRLVIEEIKRAKRDRVRVLKVAPHPYELPVQFSINSLHSGCQRTTKSRSSVQRVA